MDKNTLAHTKWNCKYHIVFGGVKLLWSFWLTDPKTPQQLDTAQRAGKSIFENAKIAE